MASYLRPRRGKKSTAESQAIVLKKGEIFFEVPDGGTGTGAGKMKMGDGATAYANLPYFSQPTVEDSVVGFTDSNTETAQSNNATYLTNIKPANTLKTIFTNLKQLLYNYNAEITQLNNDLESKISLQYIGTGTDGGQGNAPVFDFNGQPEGLYLAANSDNNRHNYGSLCLLSVGIGEYDNITYISILPMGSYVTNDTLGDKLNFSVRDNSVLVGFAYSWYANIYVFRITPFTLFPA